jgi:uncharacterized FAD-dependent dehydrogenase
VVTNGMSQYSRNERNANAGIVVGISPQTTGRTAGRRPVSPLDGMAFQRQLGERVRTSWAAAATVRPRQLVGDFIKRQVSLERSAASSPRTSRA